MRLMWSEIRRLVHWDATR